ncbi:MAG: deoxyribose-phosphate aldolase [Tidjanibacter sp.]|nr:deoxyribose-phosphate aldolase [Tidjanibacter sp.]
MEYSKLLNDYAPAMTEEQVAATVEQMRELSVKNRTKEVYKLCYSTIDLTTLTETDSVRSVGEFVAKAVEFHKHYPSIPNVASICVYPLFVDVVGLGVDNTDIGVTSVAAGFPASQTYIEVKMLEVSMAVESGADEIDVVINVGQMLEGDYDAVAAEIEMLRQEAGDDVTFKVIIESGALKTPELIRRASLLAMFAGTDFVKTSTGKIPVAATPEAAVVMCTAIKDYYQKTGRKVGFKAAGGIRTAEEAALFYTIVHEILGAEWCSPQLWRIGASSLANNLISAIEEKPVKYY